MLSGRPSHHVGVFLLNKFGRLINVYYISDIFNEQTNHYEESYRTHNSIGCNFHRHINSIYNTNLDPYIFINLACNPHVMWGLFIYLKNI